MNLRVLLIVLILGFVGLLLSLGAASFVRWLRTAYPRQFPGILFALGVGLAASGVLGYMEAQDRPTFHRNDLITLGAPLVARLVSTERLTSTRSCIVEIRGHLGVVEVASGTMKARVESNTSDPSFCPVGAEVEFQQAWLSRYTLTHRH
ncbi:MAG: hypothetical protein ACREI3_11300 [Nitrospirales bacterium]